MESPQNDTSSVAPEWLRGVGAPGTSLAGLSLRLKLSILIAGLLVAVAIFLLVFFPDRMSTLARHGLENRARGMASVLASNAAAGVEFGDTSGLQQMLNQVGRIQGVTYAQVRQGKTVLASWNWHDQAALTGATAAGKQLVLRFGSKNLHVAAPILAPGGTRGLLLMGFSLQQLERDKRHNLYTVLLASLMLVVIGVTLSYSAGTVLMRPVQRLTEITERIAAEGDLGQRIDIDSRDEVGRLAASFREMVEKLRTIPITLSELVEGVMQIIDRVTATSETVSKG